MSKREKMAVGSWDTNPLSNFCDPHWPNKYEKMGCGAGQCKDYFLLGKLCKKVEQNVTK